MVTMSHAVHKRRSAWNRRSEKMPIACGRRAAGPTVTQTNTGSKPTTTNSACALTCFGSKRVAHKGDLKNSGTKQRSSKLSKLAYPIELPNPQSFKAFTSLENRH